MCSSAPSPPLPLMPLMEPWDVGASTVLVSSQAGRAGLGSWPLLFNPWPTWPCPPALPEKLVAKVPPCLTTSVPDVYRRNSPRPESTQPGCGWAGQRMNEGQ